MFAKSNDWSCFRLLSMWSTFAATHQPITEDKSKSSSSGLTWSQRSPKEKIYLNITKVDFHTLITRKYSRAICSMCSCSDQRSQNKLLWSMKGVESLRIQLFKGFRKSRNIPGLYFWESRDRDFEKIPGSRDIPGSRWGLMMVSPPLWIVN